MKSVVLREQNLVAESMAVLERLTRRPSWCSISCGPLWCSRLETGSRRIPCGKQGSPLRRTPTFGCRWGILVRLSLIAVVASVAY
jgi:hypothetical protein